MRYITTADIMVLLSALTISLIRTFLMTHIIRTTNMIFIIGTFIGSPSSYFEYIITNTSEINLDDNDDDDDDDDDDEDGYDDDDDQTEAVLSGCGETIIGSLRLFSCFSLSSSLISSSFLSSSSALLSSSSLSYSTSLSPLLFSQSKSLWCVFSEVHINTSWQLNLNHLKKNLDVLCNTRRLLSGKVTRFRSLMKIYEMQLLKIFHIPRHYSFTGSRCGTYSDVAVFQALSLSGWSLGSLLARLMELMATVKRWIWRNLPRPLLHILHPRKSFETARVVWGKAGFLARGEGG